ncbi:phage terminase large subunit [Brevibacillus thermoruber]|uniref:phage terminase large subunit n=1 Tax=Brevibacillus thermoruber TaxID=33942 RepID=UPI00068619BA|nr:phage terminase large subunit [Brevibacillus thermoruber]
MLSERISLYEALEKKSGLTPDQRRTYLDDLREVVKLKRIDRSEHDILYFMYEYFSDERNPENDSNLITNGTPIEEAPEFHRELCAILNVVSNIEPTKRVAWAAPRGSAKSAYLSNCFPVHQIVFKKRKFIIIISETDGMARKFIDWISNQLKHNRKLREDFGELLSPNKQQNERDNLEEFVTKTGIKVQSASMGKQLRGARHLNSRPDLILMDDLESSKNTNTPELREKNLLWFNSVVMPIGDPERTAFILMGTVVHAQGLLMSVLQRADFESRIFQAIISPPEREDLWEQFETILRNQDNENRLEDALAFYHENQAEMDKGVKVLWPQRFPYVKLMLEKVNMGSRAFNSEFLNRAIDEESQIFKPETFTFFDRKDLFDEHGREKPLEYFGFWDVALGKNNRSDFNAIVTVARCKRTGIIYVVDVWNKRCPAHEALRVAADKIKEYRHKAFGVESVAAQYEFSRQLNELLAKERVYHTRIKAVIPSNKMRKEQRIEQLEPLIENGTIRFMRHHRVLLQQLEEFPNSEFDDAIDATQQAVELCMKGRSRMHYRKPRGF